MTLITNGNIENYLIQKKLLSKKERAKITLLQGGNVNTIFRIRIKAKKAKKKEKTREFVLKQTLEEPLNKKMFLKPIKLSMDRNYYEVKTMETIHALLSAPHVPEILFTDPANFVIGMTAAPEYAKLHQQECFEGKFHFDIAYELGKFTAEIHSRTFQNKEIEKMFSESPGLDLRAITIVSAFEKYPKYKKKFQEAFEKSRKNKLCLVDADITQKNILLHNETFTKLDFETVHYGDPALDVGILLAHYFLFAIRYPQWKKEYLHCAALYWQAYEQNCTFSLPKKYFENMKNYCVLMMLGRIDSDVVLTWLEGYHEKVRQLALGIFDKKINRIPELLSFVEKTI